MALSDKELLTKTQDELLDLLIEECAEVIQAAAKVKRFGPMRSRPGYNGERCNADAVIREALQVNDTLRAYCARLGVRYGDTIEWWASTEPSRKWRDFVRPSEDTPNGT
jgi:hypothetical protein